MLRRNIENRLLDGLRRAPVVYLNGARQAGKSTLAAALQESTKRTYITLDDAVLRTAAVADPQGFLEGIKGPILIDEFQLVPELFRVIKLLVDRERTPGRFLLTGSAGAMILPRLADALAGRMELRTLWPLSAGEQCGVKQDFIARLFAPDAFPLHTCTQTRAQTLDFVRRGGFPEVIQRGPRDRADWFSAYITTILTRDVRDLATVENLSALPNLLALLAARTATLLTWSSNLGKRLVKAPKLLFTDTGLAAHMLGWSDAASIVPAPSVGPLVENFVAMELQKLLGWSEVPARLYHFRTSAGLEVDFVLEDPQGRVVGIEVKSGSTVTPRDVAPLKRFAAELGDRFVRGIVFYTGDSAVPFGKNISVLPISAMWQAP